MKINEILDVVRELAKSQGLYGRLLAYWEELMENEPDEWKGVVKVLEAQNFKNAVDFILYFEC